MEAALPLMMDALEEFPRFACKKNTEKNSIKHMSMLCHKILIKIQRVTGTCNQFSGKMFLTSRNIKKGIKKMSIKKSSCIYGQTLKKTKCITIMVFENLLACSFSKLTFLIILLQLPVICMRAYFF